MSGTASGLWAKRFELLILRPLDVCLIVGAVISLFHREWVFGSFLLIVGFLIGAIGQGLPHHRQETAKELAEGRPTPLEVFRDAPEGESSERLDPDDGHAMASASIKTSVVLALIVAVVFLHFDYKWYMAVVASILVAILFPAFSAIVVMGATAWSNRKNLRAEWRIRKQQTNDAK
jgi:hypothetical protein